MSSRGLRWAVALLMVALALTIALAGCRAAEAKYPTHPITHIVYNAAGSPLDIYADAHSTQSFRSIHVIGTTQSTRWRPPVPLHCGHSFHAIPSA